MQTEKLFKINQHPLIPIAIIRLYCLSTYIKDQRNVHAAIRRPVSLVIPWILRH